MTSSILELILIVAISGMIAISVYILYLVDRLLSRIEAMERTLKSSPLMRLQKNPEELEAAIKHTYTSLADQIEAINEILQSTGKDIDSINSKISVYASDLVATSEKIEATDKKASESKRDAASIQKEISALVRKLEQLEKETDTLATRQQLSSEF